MNIGRITTADNANGIGMRVCVFVSGCRNHCKDCFQPETWDFGYGFPWDEEQEAKVLTQVGKPYHKGLTILGGEPFEEENQPYVAELVRRVKAEYPAKDIWIYTGYVLDRDLVPGGRKYTEYTDEILNGIDVLVDGPFMTDLHSILLDYRGSSNQRIIDMNKTRAEGTIVLHELMAINKVLVPGVGGDGSH